MQLKKLCAICSAVLVAFSCSLVPAVISPAFAVDSVNPDNYSGGYGRISITTKNWRPSSFTSASAEFHDFVEPFNGQSDIPGGINYITATSPYLSTEKNYYGDLFINVGLLTPTTDSLHMIFKVGCGVQSGSVTTYSSPTYHPVYNVGSAWYDDNRGSAAVTYIGNSVWGDTPRLSSATAFSDYTTGTCYRYDFTYPYAQNGFAVTGVGVWISDLYNIKLGTNQSLCPLLGYCVVWHDTGDSAVDDAVTSLLTHVAAIDGNVSSMLTTLNGILGYCRDIGADTHTIVTLLNSIDTHLDNIDDNVASLYQLMTNKTCAVGYITGSDGTAFPTVSIPYDVATSYCAYLNANFVGETVPYFSRDESTPSLTRVFNTATIGSANRLNMSFIDRVSGNVINGYMCDSAKRIFIVDPNTNYGDLINKKCNDIYTLLHDTLADETTAIDNKSQQVAESIMQEDNAEQFWNDKNQENFDALDLNNFSFSSGVVSALGTVGNLFTSIWNSLGDTVIIFTFPLMLGITLVAIGRVSRHGGKGKSGKGGDSE